MQTEYEVVDDPFHNAESMVGLDAGVSKLATLQTVRYTHQSTALKQARVSWQCFSDNYAEKLN